MAQLTIVAEGATTEHPLAELTSIGRHPDNTIVVKDLLVSGKHASIVCRNGQFELRDLGSSNGTYVNGERTSSRILAEGDLITVGKVRITFSAAVTAAEQGPSVSFSPEGSSSHIHSRVDGRGQAQFRPAEQVESFEEMKRDYESLRSPTSSTRPSVSRQTWRCSSDVSSTRPFVGSRRIAA